MVHSSYEIFDMESGNVLDVYASEPDALDALAEITFERGVEEVARFALFCETGSTTSLIAKGGELVHLVKAKHLD